MPSPLLDSGLYYFEKVRAAIDRECFARLSRRYRRRQRMLFVGSLVLVAGLSVAFFTFLSP